MDAVASVQTRELVAFGAGSISGFIANKPGLYFHQTAPAHGFIHLQSIVCSWVEAEWVLQIPASHNKVKKHDWAEKRRKNEWQKLNTLRPCHTEAIYNLRVVLGGISVVHECTSSQSSCEIVTDVSMNELL